MNSFHYHRPKSLEEGLDFLAAHGADTKILAGGTDLVVDLRQGSIRPKYVLDVSRLDELKGIQLAGGLITIGACVTLSEIYESDLLRRHAPAFQRCAASFASKQVRNVATIGGNVAHCSPCADTLPPLLIHEAKAVVASRDRMLEAPVQNVSAGAYSSSLGSDEMIVRFILRPAEDVSFADFQKVGRRKELSIARISMAFMTRLEEDGKISFLRFALGACTPTPNRMEFIEEFLLGKAPDSRTLWEAGGLLAEKMFEITGGRRSSAAYKEPAVRGLFYRMLSPLLAG